MLRMNSLFVFLFLVACSHGALKESSREPSSASYFQQVAYHPADAGSEESIEQLKTILRLRLEAQRDVWSFDNELATATEGFSLLQVPGYQDLLALRAKVEGLEHQTAEQVSLELKDPSQAARLQVAFREIKQKNSYRLLMNDFFRELAFHQGKNTVGALEGYELVELAMRVEPELRMLVEQLPPKDALSVSAGASSRELASTKKKTLKVFPSPGPAGNLNGGNFPEGTWALTYDDGPKAATTNIILDNLKKYNIAATFFWLAQLAPKNQQVVEKAKQDGHGLANHSWSHQQLTKVGQAERVKEIVNSTATLGTSYGYRPRFFRCPYGAGVNTPAIREMIAKEGMVHVFWNVDSFDWQDKNPASIVKRVKEQMALQKGGVMLFHDIHMQTVVSTEQLMQEWSKKKNLRFLTMDQVVRELNRAK